VEWHKQKCAILDLRGGHHKCSLQVLEGQWGIRFRWPWLWPPSQAPGQPGTYSDAVYSTNADTHQITNAAIAGTNEDAYDFITHSGADINSVSIDICGA
jgi:hypothetical protein